MAAAVSRMSDAELDTMRSEWESDDMWGLRKAFMQRHCNEIEDHDRLVCLSTVFINMEFMACTYNQELMDSVNRMSVGLVEKRREQRKETVENIFVKSEEDLSKERKRLEKNAKKNLRPTPMEPASKRRRGEDTPSESAAGGLKPAAGVAKERTLLLVKAQLSIAPSNLSALDLMNYCCNRAKVKWSLEFVERSGRQEFLLLVDDVMVTRQCYDGDKKAATAVGCDTAAKLLQAVSFDVKEEDVTMGDDDAGGKKSEKRFCLYTSNDKRQGWQSAETDLFAYQERHLSAVGRKLNAQVAAVRNKEPEKNLETACSSAGAPFSVDCDQLAGWKASVAAVVAGVRVAAETVSGKQLGAAQMADNRRRVCKAAQDLLVRVTAADGRVTVQEDDDGRLEVRATGKPADDGRAAPETIAQTVHDTKLILFRTADADRVQFAKSILQNSCQMSNLLIDYIPTVIDKYSCRVQVFVGGSLISQADGNNEKEASQAAAVGALKSLSAHCPTIMRKTAIDGGTTAITAEDVMSDLSGSRALSKGAASEPIASDNVGSRMLKMMGWTGGGIGKTGEGIPEPITVKQVFGRQGFGHDSSASFDSAKHQRQFGAAARRIVQDFIATEQSHDLVFGADLNAEQRAVIHRLASQYGLKSHSYGPKSNRQLTLQHKRSARQLLQLLLEQGGETSKYIVIPPGLESFDTAPPADSTNDA